MVWRTHEGFAMEPFYRREDLEGMAQTDALPGQFPYVRGNKKDNNRWYVRQNIDAADAREANAKALDLLDKGVTSLGFKIPRKELSAEFIATLLEGIKADTVELNFQTCQGHTVELARLLADYFNGKGYDPKSLVGSVNFDPVQKMLTKGKDTTPLLGQLAELVQTLAPFPKFRCVCVNADTLCNAGAYTYQELGYALAWGNEYLAQMVEAGIPAALAAKKIKFNFGIGGVYFMEIAKFRAARMLWANIVKQYGPVCPREDCENTGADKFCNCACKMQVNATTTTYNMTVFDSYVNMLRSQTEAMSAALANVDSIVVTPFDAPYETPTDFAERIARNQQLLLQEESHFDKIVDVAGGSYFVEKLTRSLAEQAWKLFLAVEDEGGFLAAAKAGSVQKALNDTDATRHADAAKRKEFLLGTNQFPNFNEKERRQGSARSLRMLPRPRRRMRETVCQTGNQPSGFRLRDFAPADRTGRQAARGLHAHHRQPGHAPGPCAIQLQLLGLRRLQSDRQSGIPHRGRRSGSRHEGRRRHRGALLQRRRICRICRPGL